MKIERIKQRCFQQFCLVHSWIASISFCFLELSSPFSLWTFKNLKKKFTEKIAYTFWHAKMCNCQFLNKQRTSWFFFVELSDFSPSFWETCTSDLWSRLFQNNNNNTGLLAFCILLFYLNQEHSFCISFKLINLNFTFAYVFFLWCCYIWHHCTKIKPNCKTD